MICALCSKAVANDELVSLCKQLLVACFNVPSLHLPVGTGDMMNLILDNQSIG